jgi:hypothetical protein
VTGLKIEKVEELPPLIRGGGSRNPEEKQAILDCLAGPDVHRIGEVTTKAKFSALQQRIRNFAKEIGVKVTVMDKVEEEQAIYFARNEPGDKALRDEKKAKTNGNGKADTNGDNPTAKVDAKTTKAPAAKK